MSPRALLTSGFSSQGQRSRSSIGIPSNLFDFQSEVLPIDVNLCLVGEYYRVQLHQNLTCSFQDASGTDNFRKYENRCQSNVTNISSNHVYDSVDSPFRIHAVTPISGIFSVFLHDQLPQNVLPNSFSGVTKVTCHPVRQLMVSPFFSSSSSQK